MNENIAGKCKECFYYVFISVDHFLLINFPSNIGGDVC